MPVRSRTVRPYSLFIALLFSVVSQLVAQTFVGPGAPPACGGIELRIIQQGERVTSIQHTIWQSFRTVVEQYRSLKDGDWQITLLFYSSRWQRNESLSNERLSEKVS